jgi:capsular polysaccharide biosynthesis protein
MLGRLKALAGRQAQAVTAPAVPTLLSRHGVALRSCVSNPDLNTWQSGFVHEPDHLHFTQRRAGTLFAVHRPAPADLPVREHLPQAHFGGVLFPFYGHFLIESLSRLPDIPDDGLPIVFMGLGDTVKDWQTRFFADTGLSSRLRFTRKDSLILVDQLFRPDQTATIHADISSRFIRHAQGLFAPSASRGRRIYLSRRQSRNAPVEHEAAFEDGLRALGIEPVCPETLPVREQVRLLDEAELVVAVEGSALHTLIFSTTPKRVLVLPRRQTLDLNFVLQFAVQEQLQVQQVHAMARRATTFKDPCTLDVEAALAGVQLALAE